MKVGDLVELSAYGRGLKNVQMYVGRHSDVALIVDIDIYQNDFTVLWSSDARHSRHVQRRDVRLVSQRQKDAPRRAGESG